jgi:hypothetical protein
MSLNCGNQQACCSSLELSTKPQWNYIDSENWRTQRKTCPSAALCTTNPTWIDPGFCGERPVTNCMSHGMPLVTPYWHIPKYKFLLQNFLYFYCYCFCYEAVLNKSSQALQPFLSSNYPWFIHQSSLAITTKQGNLARKMVMNFVCRVSLIYLFFNMA